MRDERSTDLFGNPVRDRQGLRGRPPLQIDPNDRDMVEAALARGWSNERTAKAVGISTASLKRHFRAALASRDIAQDRLELAAFAVTARKAIEDQDMSAMRQLRQMMERDQMVGATRRLKERQGSATPVRGKKELADDAARQAPGDDSEWGDLLNAGYVGDDRLN